MRLMCVWLMAVMLMVLSAWSAHADSPVAVVAAEAVWGDIARQVGGPDVTVSSILTNPAADPHAFEASPMDGRRLGTARIVIANGGGYDGWLDRLMEGSGNADRPVVLNVAALVGWRDGENAHFWYDLTMVRAVATAFAADCGAILPDRRAALQDRLQQFLDALGPLEQRIDRLRARYHGVPVAASEPIFGLMTRQIGLTMHDGDFQRAVMNGTDPGPSEVAGFERDLTDRRVRMLILNEQTTGPATDRLEQLAQGAGIPVLHVGESLPPGMRYQDWIAGMLDRLDQALAHAPPGGPT
ncbi:metal ABC transporter substrate-binding protein [Gluconacetobacter liquefaciens]|uniref:Zinc ABC transporter solute-binding protein n=2 Tax=Gluconacetobacter liquefaciens TaxID=89584 RepID=A0A370GBA3_GLULI|nr:zinc ABC transporter solute-binding protein [Gluconacetobacter liquefaciens]RDI40349.1 zinc/manganese transport system substrate-binding protein [Gluconacetobacter liquefaciens]GEB39520.1 metal ABC transporter substrate-binding protein [Gluconacetobacter liquefaciens]